MRARSRRRLRAAVLAAALMLVGFAPGGGYDLHARTFGRHLGKYVPGEPTVVVQNMPGAGSLEAVNWLFNAAGAVQRDPCRPARRGGPGERADEGHSVERPETSSGRSV